MPSSNLICRKCNANDTKLVRGLCLSCYHATHYALNRTRKLAGDAERNATIREKSKASIEAILKDAAPNTLNVQRMTPEQMVRNWHRIVGAGVNVSRRK